MKEKVLIADDAAFMRMMVKDILTKDGYDVIEAVDGSEGIEKFKEHNPAITLMDITMPNMNGFAAIKEIKKLDGGAKIIMLSACSFPKFIADTFVSGAVDFILKPFHADKLTSTVKKHAAETVRLNTDEIQRWPEAFEPDTHISQDAIDELVKKTTL